MNENLNRISRIGLVPLGWGEPPPAAVPLGRARARGGTPVAEVTFRTAAAREAIAAMSREVPELLVGAGTVHTVDQAAQAVEAEARFIVTPGYNPAVISWCLDHGVEVLPGTVSPADVEGALSFGLSVCKFFPAEAYGGVKTLKALAGPYAGVKFMPTGGVNAGNMRDYLDLPNVAAVGGSFMLPDALVKARDWEGVAALCRDTVKKMLGFSLLHVGINPREGEEPRGTAGRLAEIFGLEVRETPRAWYAGEGFEAMKQQGPGAMGHIGVGTLDLERAVAYFEARGIHFRPESLRRDGRGRLTGAVYFQEEVGGFAIHLISLG